MNYVQFLFLLSIILWPFLGCKTELNQESSPLSIDVATSFSEFSFCNPSLAKGLCKIDTSFLWPTQLAVGKHEIKTKIKDFRNLASKGDKEEFILKNPAKVVIGPHNRFYIVDKHHQTFALLENKVPLVMAEIKLNLGALSEQDFWQKMLDEKLIYPFDKDGNGPLSVPRFLDEIRGKKITDLSDDPYRSLAGAAALKGAYKKNEVPFMDFEWANFFRGEINIRPGDEGRKAVEEAVSLAQSEKARLRNLPGFIGKN